MPARRRSSYPEPTVGALILDRRGRMLLVRSPKWGERLTVAGGHVELGETLQAALEREILEEVGLRIRDVRLLLVQEAIYSSEFWEPRHFVFFDFVCRARGGSPRVDGREVTGYLWSDPEEALGMNLDSFTRRMVEAYLAGVRGPALAPRGARR